MKAVAHNQSSFHMKLRKMDHSGIANPIATRDATGKRMGKVRLPVKRSPEASLKSWAWRVDENTATVTSAAIRPVGLTWV